MKTGCTKKVDCASTPATPVCDVGSGKCVACVGAGDCAAPTPACDTTIKMCVECLAQADCTGTPATPACDVATKKCVACVGADDCAAPTPACDTTLNMCVGCLGKKDCAGTPATLVCDTTAKTCVGCLANVDCASTPATPACDTTTKTCVGCLGKADCANTPTTAVCDTSVKTCVGCLTEGDCGGATAATPRCDVPQKTCVQCLSNTDCRGATPICESKLCRACKADAECAGEPGVCMAHQDGRCATDAETIYVRNSVGVCLDVTGAPGSATVPLCSMQAAVGVVGGTRDLVVVRGAVNGASAAFTGAAKPISIVGQMSGAIAGGVNPAFHLASGDAYLRDLRVSTVASLGIQADFGSTLRLDHLLVTGNSGGGILLDGAAFDIRNTTVTSNGPGTTGAVTWGGIFTNSPPAAGPKQLNLVTVQNNMGGGIACSTAIAASPGVFVSGNTLGVDINPTCNVTACAVAGTTCGAQ